jgi:hypothetical protein
MVLGLTQPLTEMSTRNIFWGGKGGRCIVLTNSHLQVPIVLKSGILILMEPSGPVQACNGMALSFTCLHLEWNFFPEDGSSLYSRSTDSVLKVQY